jgi:hypothetical protein
LGEKREKRIPAARDFFELRGQRRKGGKREFPLRGIFLAKRSKEKRRKKRFSLIISELQINKQRSFSLQPVRAPPS